MLTLQLFKIMDRIWQNEGLDLGFVLSELQKYTGRKLATECSVLKAKEANDINQSHYPLRTSNTNPDPYQQL